VGVFTVRWSRRHVLGETFIPFLAASLEGSRDLELPSTR
jgi:hypothetical protein